MVRTQFIFALSTAALLSTFTSCGGGGGSSAPGVTASDFAGTWNLMSTVESSDCGDLPVGYESPLVIVLTAADDGTVSDNTGLSGTPSGRNLELKSSVEGFNSAMSLELSEDGNSISGTRTSERLAMASPYGDAMGSAACSAVSRISGSREQADVSGFSGTWSVQLTVEQSDDPALVGSVQNTGLHIERSGSATTVRFTDERDAFPASIDGDVLMTSRIGQGPLPGGPRGVDAVELSLQLDGDMLTGMAEITPPGGAASSVTITGNRLDNCVTIESTWYWELRDQGRFSTLTNSVSVAEGCAISFGPDSGMGVFGLLRENQFSGSWNIQLEPGQTQVEHRVTGEFLGSPANRFEGTWTRSDGSSGDVIADLESSVPCPRIGPGTWRFTINAPGHNRTFEPGGILQDRCNVEFFWSNVGTFVERLDMNGPIDADGNWSPSAVYANSGVIGGDPSNRYTNVTGTFSGNPIDSFSGTVTVFGGVEGTITGTRL